MADGVEVKNYDGRYLISMDGRYGAFNVVVGCVGRLWEDPRD